MSGIRRFLSALLLGMAALLMLLSGAQGEEYITTRQQLADFLRRCAYACQDQVSFSYASSLAGQIGNRDWFSQVMNENGITDASWRQDEGRRTVTFSRITYCEEFYRQGREPVIWLSSWAEIEAFARERAEARDGEFVFFYDASLGLSEKKQRLTGIFQRAGMQDISGSITLCRVQMTGIGYPAEFALCDSEAEVRAYLSQCASRGTAAFSLYLGEDLFQRLQANQFARLMALEGEASIVSRSLSYSAESCSIHYQDTAYRRDAARCESLAQVTQALEKGLEAGGDIPFFCTDDIYRALTANNASLLSQLAQGLGVQGFHYTLNPGAGCITLTDIRQMAGHRILQAYRTGNYAALTRREQDTLAYAVNILNGSAVPRDLLGAEKWIHDFLCQRITYEIDPWSEEDDCAVGALLNGRANCDGYSDAFYLLGGLVGMEIRCQAGDALRTDGDAGHMWNLIHLGDGWYMVDVTWNDTDGADPAHIWYNLGADFAGYSHTWEEIGGLPSMAAKTENGYRPYPIYRCYSFDDLSKIMADCRAQGTDRADIFYGYGASLYADSSRTYDTMRRAGVRGEIRSRWYEKPGFVHFYGLEY